jgi:hypothetical protein
MGMKALALMTTAVSLWTVALGGCGGSSGDPAHRANAGAAAGPGAVLQLPRIELKGDPDLDSDTYGSEPDDENEPLGHPASAGDARAVAALVKHYYAVVARGDGAGACRLLYSSIAESMVEDYGEGSGAADPRGRTCAAVVSRLLAAKRRLLADDSRTLRVTAVRVDLNRGSAQLGFDGAKLTHYLLVHRERGSWKMDSLFAVDRPVGVE